MQRGRFSFSVKAARACIGTIGTIRTLNKGIIAHTRSALNYKVTYERASTLGAPRVVNPCKRLQKNLRTMDGRRSSPN